MITKESDLKNLYCLCIHGHFYQPPRDNPFLEIIETQKSASPYHDWNERITRECYGPNARGRLLGEMGQIIKLINNYAYMSFDFGPTLLSWLEVEHPWVYSQIIDADKEGQIRYNGHGNALAHVYNHIIMPLASTRDKLTQIRWGLSDFRYRFGRDAEGMWLAETAVNMETLELLADEGIKFTILSPDQALAIRSIAPSPSTSRLQKDTTRASETWVDVKGGRIDPTRPYRIFINREDNKFIDVFFYDGPLSRSIAYEKILSSGSALAGRINSILENHKEGPRILNIATDGESYGHHFKFGEMALSWLFDTIEKEGKIKLVNYGYFLELCPPKREVKIIENSSWSCAHGVERWRSDCGCNVNGKKEWNQKWRTPLRNGLDWLSKELSIIFESRASRLLKNPWDARNDYIRTILSNSEMGSFFLLHSIRPLNQDEKTEVLCLMESQRMALYMFTSCGWFFDDISGIESIQILMYASRAIELIRRSSPNDLEKGLLDFLAQAESNDPAYKNGSRIYDLMVSPSKMTPSSAAAHYATIALLDDINSNKYPVLELITPLQQNKFKVNGVKVVLGKVQVTEKRTDKKTEKTFLAVKGKNQEFNFAVGAVTASDYDVINDEIATSLSESSENLMTIFSMKAQDVNYFTLSDLIADVRIGVIKSIGESLYKKIAFLIESEKITFEELIDLLDLTKVRPPSYLNNIIRIFFVETFSNLLFDSENKLIDFNKFLRNLKLLQPAFLLNIDENSEQTSLSEIIKIPEYKTLVEKFLLKNIKACFSSDKVIIENIVNLLKLVGSAKIELDLWDCQNIFYDSCMVSGRINKNNSNMTSILSELGTLLGFLIEEK